MYLNPLEVFNVCVGHNIPTQEHPPQYRLVQLITVSSYNRVNPKYGILVRFMSLSVGRKLKNQIFVNIGIY